MVSPLEAVRRLVETERLGAVVSVVDGPGTGAKGVLDRTEGLVAGMIPDDIAADVVSDAANLMDREQNRTLAYGDRHVYIETVAPQPQLVIFGAVHIAQELCRMAHGLGFRVIVNDARAFFTTKERFPEADSVIVGWPEEVADQLVIDGRTYVVLLSHDARFEDPVLPLVLPGPAKYIGVMGSRRTHRRRVDRLRAAGFEEGPDRPYPRAGRARHRRRTARRSGSRHPGRDDPGPVQLGIRRVPVGSAGTHPPPAHGGRRRPMTVPGWAGSGGNHSPHPA